jgi:hypothetical protein
MQSLRVNKDGVSASLEKATSNINGSAAYEESRNVGC